jgi:lysophospholipase L1-like esterase
MKKINIWLIALLFWGLTACNIDPAPTPVAPAPGTPPSPGTANFTKYVAVGNSLTAGFSDNGLFRAGQLVSYPNLLSQQFARAGGGAFIQPLFTEAERNGSGFLRLVGVPAASGPVLETVNTNLAVLRTRNTTQAGVLPIFTQFTGANQNLGVPGIFLGQVTTAGLGAENDQQFNPYFERFLADDGVNPFTTYAQYTATQSSDATFFTMWLGNNDVLFTAASGGLAPSTSVGTFETSLDAMLDILTANGAKGVIANIPDVTAGAFFKTITEARILSQVNAGLPTGFPPFQDLFIQTAAGARAMGTSDLLLLGSQANYANIGRQDFGAGLPFPYGLHPNNPITTGAVLDSDEVNTVRNTIASYNALISTEATTRNLGLVDAFAILNQWAVSGTGASYPLNYGLTFITGGIASLDGVHLTPAGNALIANEFLKVINAKFNSTFSLINPLNYSTLANVRYQ